MRFEIGDEAAALRDASAELLANEVPPAVVRAGWPGGDPAAVTAAWRKLASAGGTGVLVEEDRGGLGLDENSACPLFEELGHCALPVPAVETVAVAAPLLASASGGELSAMLDGECLVAAQLAGGDLVPYGQTADLVLLRHEGALRLHRRDELHLEDVATVDASRRTARLAAAPPAGRLLTDDPAEVESAWQRGVLGTSALLVGLARRMLDMTVDYVKQRHQFGVPVGSFQAVKHALASAHMAVEFARPLVHAAGWGRSVGAVDAAQQTSAAKVAASDAARLVARTAVQCHGAMGYTTEYDLHLFAKRVWALAPSWGDPAWHRARLASSLGIGE